MKKKILAFILSGCMLMQNSGLIALAAEIPLYTQEEAETETDTYGQPAAPELGGDNETLSGTEPGENDNGQPSDTELGGDNDESSNTEPEENDNGQSSAPALGENNETPSDAEGGDSSASSDAESGDNNETSSDTVTEDDEIPSETGIEEENDDIETPGQDMTLVSENDREEAVGEAIAIQVDSAEKREDNIQYAYVPADDYAQTAADEQALSSQSIGASKAGLYFGYVETDSEKHIGTLKEYISESGTITLPHKLGTSYMVEIGDSVFAGMDDTDPSDASKLPKQSASGKTLQSSGETKILELLNAERIKKGKVPLVMSSTLRETARCKTLDMYNKNYFDHKDPNGVYSYTWLKDCGYPLRSWAENIAYNYEGAEKLYTQWKNSSGHYKNMMEDSYRSIGVGVYKDGNGKVMGTQVFSNVIFQNLTSVTIEFGYEKIGNNAFKGCKNLKTITIPSTVTEIADTAFAGCTKLTIRGKAGSYAQTFAAAHGITFQAVNEKSPIEKFGFEEKELFLEVGDWDFVGVSIKPVDYEHLVKLEETEVPEEKDKKVLEFQKDGTVHAISKGTAEVKARAADMEEICKITVGDAIPVAMKSISFYDEELILYEGECIKPSYKIDPINTTDTLRLISSDNGIFTVNEDKPLEITAIKAGNAVLTVSGISADNTVTVSASIDVRVMTVDEELELPENLKAVTNISSVLSGVPLPEGFSWKEPQTKLKANAKMPVQYFGAQYRDDDKNILQDCILPVEVSSVSGLLVDMAGQKLASGTKLSLLDQYELEASVKSVGAKVDSTFLDVKYSVDNSGIINIEEKTEEGKTSQLLTPKKAGKCSVTVEVKLKDRNGSYGPAKKPYGTYKKKYTFTVENTAHVSDFKIELVPETQSRIRFLADGSIQADDDATKFQIRATALDANGESNNSALKNTKLKFKADKSGVLKINAVKGQNGLVEVDVKKVGKAVLTVTAQDNGKHSKDIAIYVRKFSPQLNGKTWTLNKLKPDAAALVDIQAVSGNPIQSATLYEDKETKKVANLFSVQFDDEDASYKIGFKDGKVSNVTKGSYKLFLKVSTNANVDTAAANTTEGDVSSATPGAATAAAQDSDADVREYVYPLTVKLKNTKPSIKLKQSAKINLFYKDAQAGLEINTGAEKLTDIEQINVANSTPHFEADFDKKEDGTWNASLCPVGVTSSNYKKIVKTIELKFYFEDYGKTYYITKKLSVKNCYQKAPLYPAYSQVLVYSAIGDNQAVFQIKDKASGKPLTIGGENNVKVQLGDGMSAKLQLETNDGGQDIHINWIEKKKKDFTAKLMVSHDNWREAVPLSLKLALNAQTPLLRLEETKIALNTNAVGKEIYNIKVSADKNDAVNIVRLKAVDIVGTNAAAKKLLSENKITIYPQKDGNGRSLKICLNSSNVKNGTYKYKVYGWCMRGKDRIQRMNPVTLSIAVTNKQPSATLKAKGKINISDPENTEIIYTPKLSNAAGNIRSASLDGAYASQFELDKREDGTYQVKLKAGSKLGKGTYKLYFIFILDNGIKVESKAAAVKL